MKTEKELNSIISSMTVEEKIGAVCTFGFNGSIPTPNVIDYITKLHCGGLRLMPYARVFGSYVNPKTGKTVIEIKDQRYLYKKGVPAPEVTAEDYRGTLDRLQAIARARPSGVPLHFSYDQEGDGTEANNCFAGVKMFPKLMGIRATNDPKIAYEVARATGRMGRAIGFNYVHGPVVDISVEPRSIEVYNRSASNLFEEVTEYALATAQGYKDSGMIATVKHFPGRGDSPVDAHYEIPVIDVDRETLLNRELLPYVHLIKAGVAPSIMLAHSIYPAIDEEHIATVSKKVVTGLLREELGYDGVITTDSMTMGGIAVKYGVPEACAMSLAAGADLVLMKAQNTLVEDTWHAIERYVEEGKITEEMLDEKILRILKLKNEYGLFEETYERETVEEVLSDKGIDDLGALVGRRSLTVLREEKGVLPLARDEENVVIEQVYTLANNAYMHPGKLFFHCASLNSNTAYAEVSLKADSVDEEVIRQCFERYSTIVATNFYGRGAGSNTELLEELIQKYPEKKVIVIGNTPYAISTPASAKTVLISFGYTKESLEAVGNYLYGEGPAEGIMPVTNGLRER